MTVKLAQKSLFDVAEITIKSKGIGEDNEGWEHTRYILAIRNVATGEEWTGVKFHTGMAYTKPPTVEEVLWALSLDAQAGEDNQTFESFCYDYGFDEDSRQVFKTWKACRKVHRKWIEFFSDEQRMAISEATEDM